MNCFLFALFIFTFYTKTFSEKVYVQTDTEKWTHAIPPGFLSITVDPVTLFSTGALPGPTSEMAKALSPAFVRICGEGTDSLHFGEKLFENNTSLTDVEIDSVMKFANDADLRIIVGLNPTERQDEYWNSENALKIMSYMNQKGYKASWQLGCGLNNPHLSGVHLATDFLKLKTLVDKFPLFSKSLVLGPDFDNDNIAILKDFLRYTGGSLSSVLISLKAQSIHNLELQVKKLVKNFEKAVNYQNIDPTEENLKKSLFLADNEASAGTFKQAKQLAKTLGTAAAHGCKTVFRKLSQTSLTSVTPEFWFSALYKALVGRYVFNTKLLSSSNNLHVYSHSTPTFKTQLLGKHYTNGSLTIFGVNDSPNGELLEMKDTPKDGSIHVFFLTTQLQGLNEVALLNGQELSMNKYKLPRLTPTVKKGGLVYIPGDSIFFIVLPEAGLTTFSAPSSRSVSKREILMKQSDIKRLTELDQKYRNFAKNILHNRILKDSGLVQEKKDDMSVSFITYNNNGWLNDLLDHILSNKGNQIPEQSDPTENSKPIRLKRSAKLFQEDNESIPTDKINEANTVDLEEEGAENPIGADKITMDELSQPIKDSIFNGNSMDAQEVGEDGDQGRIDQALFNIVNEEEKLLNTSSQAQIQSEQSGPSSSEEIENKAGNNEDLVMENEFEDPFIPQDHPAGSQDSSDIMNVPVPENINRYDFNKFSNLKTSYVVNPQHGVPQQPPEIPQYLPKHQATPSNPQLFNSQTSYPSKTSELLLNEKKENMINSIMTKIVSKENALYKNKPVNPSKTGTVEEVDTSPLVQVVVPETDLDVYVPLSSIDPEEDGVAQQTLNQGYNLILPSEDKPTIKVQRQINEDPLYKKNPVRKVQGYLTDILSKVPRQTPILALPDLPEPNESNKDKVYQLPSLPKKLTQPLSVTSHFPEMNDPLYTSKLTEAVKSFIEQRKIEYDAIKAKMTSVRQKVLESPANIINNDELTKSLKQRSEEIKTILKQMEPDGMSSKIHLPLYIPNIRAKRSVKARFFDGPILNVNANKFDTHERMKRSFSEEIDKFIEKARNWWEDINPFSSSKRSKRTILPMYTDDVSKNDLQDDSIKMPQNSDAEIDINSRQIKDLLLKKIKGKPGLYKFTKKYSKLLDNFEKNEQNTDFGSTGIEGNSKNLNGILEKTDPCRGSVQIDGANENTNRKDIAVVEFAVSTKGQETIEDETWFKQFFQGMVMFFSMMNQLMEN